MPLPLSQHFQEAKNSSIQDYLIKLRQLQFTLLKARNNYALNPTSLYWNNKSDRIPLYF